MLLKYINDNALMDIIKIERVEALYDGKTLRVTKMNGEIINIPVESLISIYKGGI